VTKEELLRQQMKKAEPDRLEKLNLLPPSNMYERGNWQTFEDMKVSSGMEEQEENPEQIKNVDKQLITCVFEE